MTVSKGWGEAQFEGIWRSEIEAINLRRRELGRVPIEILGTGGGGPKVTETVAVALSGGGVRSAAFSLGVLQALNHHDVLRNVDYLSTVSGGGYIGSSLTATMSVRKGEFVFENPPAGKDAPIATAVPAPEISDSDSVGHIRNYSNYLIPAGLRDVLTGLAIVVRGLVANLSLVLPIILLAAAVTVASNRSRSALTRPDFVGIPLEMYLPVEHFGITLALGLFGLAAFFLWALYRSFLPVNRMAEFRTRLPAWGAGYLVVLFAAFACELQPFIVAGMFDIADAAAGRESGLVLGLVTAWVQKLAAVAAPVAAAVTFFRQQVADILKSASATSSWQLKVVALASKIAVWIAGAALPLAILVVYLYLAYWGIINDKKYEDVQTTCPVSTLSGSLTVDGRALSLRGELGKLQIGSQEACTPKVAKAVEPGGHTPQWMLTSAGWVSEKILGRVSERPMALLYLVTGILLFLLSWLLTPNANSLHRLYRDRLSKAFLFDPTPRDDQAPGRNEASIDQGRDFPQLDQMRVSALSVEHAPYHLINAALNIQGSDYANRRGRNADFFLFSPHHVGSWATGYAATRDFEREAPELDLATAVAISGAAASSNMGANSIRPLTPTLALLNVRLGYWLKNPRYVRATKNSGRGMMAIVERRSKFYLWEEITGRLYENSDEIYLTDGGHIENLGVYELLRRRCRVIIAVDAEADPEMRFSSLITLQRYARIDLGVRIDMPWDRIRTSTLPLMGKGSVESKDAEAAAARPRGPHVAIGTIDYGDDKGFLVYLKSSLTGDENDYIRDYARRYSAFPHETTGDQFFSEEQFEVYRALGFHIAHGLLCGEDKVQVVGADALTKFDDPANEAVKSVSAALTG